MIIMKEEKSFWLGTNRLIEAVISHLSIIPFLFTPPPYFFALIRICRVTLSPWTPVPADFATINAHNIK